MRSLLPYVRHLWSHYRTSLTLAISSLSLQFLVYDYDSSGKHDFIGEFTSTFKEMQEGTANPGQEVPKTPSCPQDLWENPDRGSAEHITLSDWRQGGWGMPRLGRRTGS